MYNCPRCYSSVTVSYYYMDVRICKAVDLSPATAATEFSPRPHVTTIDSYRFQQVFLVPVTSFSVAICILNKDPPAGLKKTYYILSILGSNDATNYSYC